MKRRAQHNRAYDNRGSVLLGALILVFIVSAGAALVWRGLQQQVARQHGEARQEQVQQIAEAGLDTAIAMLRSNRSYAGEQDTALGGGHFTVAVAPEAGDAFRITSEARLSDGPIVRATSTLLATVRLDAAGNLVACQWRRKER